MAAQHHDAAPPLAYLSVDDSRAAGVVPLGTAAAEGVAVSATAQRGAVYPSAFVRHARLAALQALLAEKGFALCFTGAGIYIVMCQSHHRMLDTLADAPHRAVQIGAVL